MDALAILPFLAIDINIDPTFATWGSLTLTWHGLFTAIGIILRPRASATSVTRRSRRSANARRWRPWPRDESRGVADDTVVVPAGVS